MRCPLDGRAYDTSQQQKLSRPSSRDQADGEPQIDVASIEHHVSDRFQNSLNFVTRTESLLLRSSALPAPALVQ
jgi:hypothetical protein